MLHMVELFLHHTPSAAHVDPCSISAITVQQQSNSQKKWVRVAEDVPQWSSKGVLDKDFALIKFGLRSASQSRRHKIVGSSAFVQTRAYSARCTSTCKV